jgi:hypothetical protein
MASSTRSNTIASSSLPTWWTTRPGHTACTTTLAVFDPPLRGTELDGSTSSSVRE